LRQAQKFFKAIIFSEVDGAFDNIIFAAPWSEGEITKPLDYALYDNGVVARFLREADSYLKENGSIWLQYCDAFPNNFRQLSTWIKAGGFES
jgi:16S rRNA G1207 methylase RsmC